MADYNEVCYHCGRNLKEETTEWLELRWTDNTWHPAESLDPGVSQGHFPFGHTCVKKVLAGTVPVGHYT